MTSVTYPQCAIPAARAESHSVGAYPQTTNSVFVTSQHAHTLALQCVPHIASPVVIPTEKDTSRDGKCDGRDTAQNVVVCEGIEFSVSSDVK